LYQVSFSKTDAYTPDKKQYEMLKTILSLYKEGLRLADREEFDFSIVEKLPIIEKVAKVKELEVRENDTKDFESLRKEVSTVFALL